jgi:hypothetical protein
MADFTYLTSQTERGSLASFGVGDRKAYFLASTAMTGHRVIGLALQALSDGLATTGDIIQARAADVTATGFAKLATETIVARVAPSFNALRSAIAEAEADREKRMEIFGAPHFSTNEPPAVRVERRHYAKSLPLPALMDAVQKDGSLAAAIIEGGLAMSGLPANIFDRLKRDLAVANATRILAGQRAYRTVPDANDPIGGKPDHDAARAAGEELIAAIESEQTLLSEAPATLTAVVNIVAIMTDTTRDDAFKLLAA